MLAIGMRYRSKLEKGLLPYTNGILWLPDNPELDPRLAGHADLSVFASSHAVIASQSAYHSIVNSLTCDIAIIKASAQQPLYPGDAGLCICRTGTFTIYNPKSIDPIAKPYLDGIGIPVQQGYTKCSVCVVSENSIITSDRIIEAKARSAGMDVLPIVPGHIKLDGYEYGFIGGATFLTERNVLAFTGHLNEHPDKSIILAFLATHGVKPVFLTDKPLFDVGSAISLP